MNHYFTTFPTPLGLFSAAIDETGAISATAFGDLTVLKTRLRGLRPIQDDQRLRGIREYVQAYFAGNVCAASLALAPQGTAFQQRVWRALQDIPIGETRTYGQLAQAIGTPFASRAVGRANATNPICLLIPCHRVIGADGSLTGFAFGEDIKRHLLEHERSVVARTRAA